MSARSALGHAPWLVALSVCLGGGCRALGCSDPPLESYVDVPTTLEAVKDLDDPPDVVVAVERVKRETSSHFACGHSAACIIFLPVALVAPLFPEKWDQVTVTEGGVVTYEARFSTGGEFLEGTQRKDGVARAIGVLALQRVEKRLIVEIARAPIGPDGGTGEFVKTPILPQVDLAPIYAAKLASFTRPEDRADLFEEYATWLGDESLPWLEDVVPKEPAESATLVLATLCDGRLTARWPAGCARVLDAIAESPAMPLAGVAFEHSLDKEDHERSLKLGRYLVSQACGDAVEVALPKLAGLHEDVRPERAAREAKLLAPLREDARACESPRRTHLAVALREEVPREDISRALEVGDGGARVLIELLPVAEPLTRELLLEVVREREERDELRSRALQRLSFSKVPPDAQELELMVDDYLSPPADAKRRASDRACALARFATARHAGVALDEARGRLEKAFDGAAAADRPALAIALVHLGQADRAATATIAFSGAEFVPHLCGDVRDDNSLVGFGLFRAGCTPAEALVLQRRAADRADGGAESQREPKGSLCVKLDRVPD